MKKSMKKNGKNLFGSTFYLVPMFQKVIQVGLKRIFIYKYIFKVFLYTSIFDVLYSNFLLTSNYYKEHYYTI